MPKIFSQQMSDNFYLVLCPLKYTGLESLQNLWVEHGNHETWDNLSINIISRVVTVTLEKEENKSIYAVSCYFFHHTLRAYITVK